MPAEAHRLTRVPGRRDRLVVAAVSVGAAVAAAVGVATAELDRRAPAAANGCVSFAEAGVLGGGAWHVCGVDAVRLCTSRPRSTPALRQQCARLERKAGGGS